MKICAIQPPYGHTPELTEETFQFILKELENCDESLDLILTPEYSNSPGTLPQETALAFAQAHRQALEDAARRTAKRCNAVVALSYGALADGKERNATRLFLPSGEVAGEYFKQQLVPAEPRNHGVDNSYALEPRTPTIVEVNSIRYAFVICYDAYYEEYFSYLAHEKPDIILVSAMQRAEKSEILRLINRDLAFHVNAFVLRASYSMGETSLEGGTSLVIDPSGTILADMGEKTGRLICEIGDPKKKYMRSNSFRGKMMLNDEFIEQGRTPWAYRPCGPFVRLEEQRMPYPRICAHRGFHTQLPENTLPAFGAAIALGADEIEFDLRETADGMLVAVHDGHLDRISDGTGSVHEKTYEELLQLDFGAKTHESLKRLRIVTFEEILKKFARQCVMNIHIKEEETAPVFPRSVIRKIADLLHRYDCEKYAYFMGTPNVHEAAIEVAPEIPRCMGADGDMEKMQIVERAIRCGCKKVQFFKPHFNQKLIDQAHENGMLCNLFWSDDPEETRRVLEMGIDTVLTNNYYAVAQVRDAFLKTKEK